MIRYYSHVLKEFGEATIPTTVYDKNQACISFVNEERRRNKHIGVRDHVGQHAVNIVAVKLEYCSTTEIMADTLTKPSVPQTFKAVKDLITMTVSFHDTV